MSTELDITPQSLLEAVNAILRSVGERPVNSLGVNRLDVTNATKAITDANRLVQSRGWDFNTELEVWVAPSVPDKELQLQNNVLQLGISERSLSSTTQYYVQRGRRLYDRKNRTYEFDQGVYIDQVVNLDWGDLPEPAKLYIYRRAGIDFQMGQSPSAILVRFSESDASIAWAELLRYDTKRAHLNLQRSPGIYQGLRNHYG